MLSKVQTQLPTFIQYAIYANNKETINKLDTDVLLSYQAQALAYAIREYRNQALLALLEIGCDPESGSVNALTLAVQEGNDEAVQFLLDHGAKIDNTKDCDSPLFIAARRKNEESTRTYPNPDHWNNIYHKLAAKGATLQHQSIKTPQQHSRHFIGESVRNHASALAVGDLPGLLLPIFGFFSGLVHGSIRALTRTPIDAEKIHKLVSALTNFPESKKVQTIAEIVKQYEKSQSLASSKSSQELLQILKYPDLTANIKWNYIKRYINEGNLDYAVQYSYAEEGGYESTGDQKMFYKNNGKKFYGIIADTILSQMKELDYQISASPGR
jgi:hypothetical protein